MKFFKGDSIELEITANTDITDWELRAELCDVAGHSVKVATENAGGSDIQIKVDDASNGVFTIYIEKDLTDDFNDNATFEIEAVTNTGKKLTIYQGDVIMKEQKIKWSSPS